MEADFMYSFSYCKTSDKCVADKWNKFNAYCDEPWIPGYKLDIFGDCGANIQEPCVNFAFSTVNEG